MKKILFFSLLAGMALAGCTNDELVNGSVFGGDNDYIRFTYHSSNMTRAGGSDKLQNTHYEFGVFADNGGEVMNNYLVAYGDNAHYNSLIAGATTYGDPTSQVDGLSYWFYESLGKNSPYVHTSYNTPDLDQDLKYWDKSKDAYEFWAYAPYTNTTDGTVTQQNALKVAFGSDAFTFTSLSSFYTTPQTQIATADISAGATDAELINYNEGLYAYTKYENSQYGTDVPFEFKHINAKVNVKFYSDIQGYKVKIIDAIPEELNGGGPTNWTTKLSTAYGIQFSPATTLQSWVKMKETQPAAEELPTYYENADVTVSALSTSPTIAVAKNASYTPVNKNLIFQTTGSNVIGTTKASATASPTTLYVLPNNGITDTQTETWRSGTTPASIDALGETVWSDATTTHVADSTGYTLHLSYELVPNDGSAHIKMYDARVFVPASACQWEAGKAYTYIFKITKNSNGVTNPLTADDPATRTDATDPATSKEPYVDVTDPRVNDEQGLQPIVFDGVTVTDYVDSELGDYVISEKTLDWSIENAFKNIKKLFSNGGTQTGAAIYGAKTGDGTATTPYNVVLNSVTSDYLDYSIGDISNQCNTFKDVQAMVQALYNEDGIEKIEYDGNVYTRAEGTTDHGQKIRTFYLNGNTGSGCVRLETAISKEFISDVYSNFDFTSKQIKVISANEANTDSPIYLTIEVNNTADETANGAKIQKVVYNFSAKSAGGLDIEKTGIKAYTLTLNATDGDLMWPAYPANVDANNNNVYKDIRAFLDGVIPTPFTEGTYDSSTTDAEGLANKIAATVFPTAQAKFGTPSTTPYDIDGGVLILGDITVTLKLNLTVK
ncbi:MAG: hypothetical protein MJZ08_07785 [Bacteroidaceae bacterium]|nr:hypothetical protein [Bacteroidaceae bacterium]